MKRISIGMRNIKTAISVFVAISLFLILVLIDKSIGNSGDGFSGFSGIYTPFFAGIAAAYTSHKDYKSSLKQAKIRSVGSIIGGYFGMIVILMVEFVFIKTFPINDHLLYKFIEFSFVSFGIVFLIYINVLTKQTDATFISCLTYLSVTISVRNGGMEIAQFATNRILSTLIGVAIALFVNNFRIHYKKNKNILFIANLDENIKYNSTSLAYTRYKINDLYQRDAKLALHTSKSGIDEVLFKEVNINKPLILMSGVCIYDASSKNYIYSCDFDYDVKIKLNKYVSENKYDVFTYVIHDYRLAVHYLELESIAGKKYYEVERNNNVYPFVHAPVIDLNDVAMYQVILKCEDYEKISNDFLKFEISSKITIKLEKAPIKGYYVVSIKPINGHRTEAIKHLPYYDECDYKVAFISHDSDLKIGQIADFKICLDNSSENIKNMSNYIVKSNDFNDVLKIFNKIYYARNINKYLKRLENK